ncbi:MAG: glycoside hydrolase family 16 protein [Chlorobi bacterium]|nr:glycoside hydrolase family 16 protein [Chlorobiota bacterium]
MGNIAFGNKYFILSKFSSIPKTPKIEQDRANLIKEHEDFIAFENSSGFADFVELEKYINSKEHKDILDSVRSQKQNLDGKEKLYHSQKKARVFKRYFKFKESTKLKDYYNFKESKELADYLESKGGENEIKASSAIKRHIKFENSQKFKDFKNFEKSKELADFTELEEYLNSGEYKELVNSLEERENAENEKTKKFEEFKNSKKYKWYLALKGSDKFDELKSWEITFEDNFDGKKLDGEKWMTRYLWGDKLINDAYALETDKAFPTDGNNIELSGKTLKIVTRNEKTTGKVWKVPFGFIPQEFDFTTGLISTANRFKQKYGRFEAKIKVNYSKPVNYNFWMASDKMLPHVDILKLDKKKTKVDMAHHYGGASKTPEKRTAEFKGLDVSQDFFIYTFEWTKEKMTWKINGVVVNEQTQGIPKEEMYLVFSSAITGKVDGGLPASMEIDWVRCYKRV